VLARNPIQLAAVVVTAVLAGGCIGGSGGGPVPTLGRDDVTNLPAGDATGTSFSGYYLIASSEIDGCRCRVGQCAVFYAKIGALRQLQQADGLFSEVGYAPGPTGGVNRDGTFWLGLSDESSDATKYFLMEGHIQAAEGVPVSGTYTATSTVAGTVYTMDGESAVDCDLRVTCTIRYEGPLDGG
jgi:hypothetical protein